MRHFFLSLGLIALLWPSAGHAKPLLTSSQDTYASVCIDFDDSYDRLIQICQKALEEAGASQTQTLQMMDSLGWAFYQTDNEDQALAVFQDMLTKDSRSADAWLGLGWIAYDNNKFGEATDWFGKAAAVSPSAEAISALGSSLFRSDQIALPKALNYIDAALSINRDYAWAVREKAWLLSDDGQYKAAETSFRRALDIEPNDANALYGLADTLSELDQYDDALLIANQLLDDYPNHVSALALRSLVLYLMDRPVQAIKDADKLIALRPNWATSYVRKARPLSDIGRREDAIGLLAAAEDRIGYDSFLTYWRAKLFLSDARYSAAMAQVTRVFNKGDEDKYDFRLRTRIALEMGDAAHARTYVDAGLAKRPNDRYLMYYDAMIMVSEDQFDTAEARFDEANELGLSVWYLSNFISALVGKSRFMQAIQMRVRYSDKAEEQN